MTKQYKLEAINNICHRIAKLITEASEIEEEGKGEEDVLYEKVFTSIHNILNLCTPSTVNRINNNIDTFLCS